MKLIRQKNQKSDYTDMFGNKLGQGHIVAVRYAWNSYVGIIRRQGLSLHEGAKRFYGAAAFHGLSDTATYQILGHTNTKHKDFNGSIINWFKSETGNCPKKIKVYE